MLSADDRQVLEFELQHWRYAGAREQAIHDLFGYSPTRHAQRVNALLDDPDAYAEFPMLLKRLRRIREAGQADRTERRLTIRLPGT